MIKKKKSVADAPIVALVQKTKFPVENNMELKDLPGRRGFIGLSCHLAQDREACSQEIVKAMLLTDYLHIVLSCQKCGTPRGFVY